MNTAPQQPPEPKPFVGRCHHLAWYGDTASVRVRVDALHADEPLDITLCGQCARFIRAQLQYGMVIAQPVQL